LGRIRGARTEHGNCTSGHEQAVAESSDLHHRNAKALGATRSERASVIHGTTTSIA
jgi:hypothetical protein